MSHYLFTLRWILPVPRKCKKSGKVCVVCTMLYFALGYFFSVILIYSTLFCSVLFCSVLFYSILFYSILFYSILLFCSIATNMNDMFYSIATNMNFLSNFNIQPGVRSNTRVIIKEITGEFPAESFLQAASWLLKLVDCEPSTEPGLTMMMMWR